MSTRSILVVDDDPAVIETFALMLQLEGFDVCTAGGAEDGLRQALARRMDAIILDLRMPLVDGLEFLRRLRAGVHAYDTPVAIVTGDYLIDETVIDTARDLGATIKFKPLWVDDLVTVTRDLLRCERPAL
jgi:DNA-binding response OmpR family regulator